MGRRHPQAWERQRTVDGSILLDEGRLLGPKRRRAPPVTDADEGLVRHETHAADGSSAPEDPWVLHGLLQWWALRGSNPRPSDYESPALTD